MNAVLINTLKAVAFVVVVVSAITCMYAATNAFAVYTNLNVFMSGTLVILIAVLAGPLFCFFAAYGLVFYSDRSLSTAVVIVLPTLLAWTVNTARLAIGFLRA